MKKKGKRTVHLNVFSLDLLPVPFELPASASRSTGRCTYEGQARSSPSSALDRLTPAVGCRIPYASWLGGNAGVEVRRRGEGGSLNVV